MTSTAPGRSKVFTLESRLSSSRIGARTIASTPTGTLTKKIHSQLRASVRIPPMRTPAAAPKPPTAPQTPSAMFRSRPFMERRGQDGERCGSDDRRAEPLEARAAISDASDQARPAKSEERVKTTRPPRKIRLRPRRSAERPPRSRNPPKKSAYALITHCRFSCENPRSTWIDGSATFTMAMSRTTMNWTTLRSASASHFRFAVAVMSSDSFRFRRDVLAT